MAKPDRITKLSDSIKRREKESKHALAQLKTFRKMFYDAIEDVLSALVFKGVESVEKPKRKKNENGQHSLSFTWNGYQFVCMPYLGTALPPPEEADLLGELARRHAGRLTVFAYSPGEPESSITMCDHYVFPDGSWCACGLEHAVYTDLTAKEISRYTLNLFRKLESQFALMWCPQHHTQLGANGGSCSRLAKHPIISKD
jgi:hypothetical protein